MKKTPRLHIITSLVTAASLISIAAPTALAASPTTSTAQTSPAASASHLAAIQARGDSDITSRLTSLTGLISKVNAAKKLTNDQKSTLVTELQGEVTSLTALKSKLDAETDVPAAKTDFQNIFAQHYIYAFYVPRIQRIIAADSEIDAVATLTTLTTTLQGYINQAKANGTDTTDLQAKLTDMQAKTATASTQAQEALNTLLPLTASGHPGNKATVQQAATTLKAGRTSLEAARTDAKSISGSVKTILNLK